MMNKREADVLKLAASSVTKQREIAKILHCSLGSANNAMSVLKKSGLLDKSGQLTQKARTLLADNGPQRAIILAAGFGMRMVPINTEIPKGLIEVHREPLIERLIRQLHAVGVTDINIVVGFLKEQYEYLIDKFSVRLIVNRDYATKNNLHSLLLAMEHIGNSYIVPCDIWFRDNPFSPVELYSRYLLSEEVTKESNISFDRANIIVKTRNGAGNQMVGLCYLTEETAQPFKKRLAQLGADYRFDNAFWEDALFGKFDIPIYADITTLGNAVEINTYEQLRELDPNSQNLNAKAIMAIADTLHVKRSDIVSISLLKKGMTNRSFLFTCKEQKYIMRVPGEGTDKLINRRQECAVYETLKGSGISDEVLYINADTGYKLTKYWEDARVCNPFDFEDVELCFSKLRQFHERKLSVQHVFDLFGQIKKYEHLRGAHSVYKDYPETKDAVFSLKSFIDGLQKPFTLTHIDAVPDNFLFVNMDGKREIRLIDWEYAGMQDPHVDIAMFCIYSMYSEAEVDKAIDLYFKGKYDEQTRMKIYCYIAICGLLWSNWCEYKRNLGVDFGEYSIAQYRFAKVYSRKVKKYLEDSNESRK